MQTALAWRVVSGHCQRWDSCTHYTYYNRFASAIKVRDCACWRWWKSVNDFRVTYCPIHLSAHKFLYVWISRYRPCISGLHRFKQIHELKWSLNLSYYRIVEAGHARNERLFQYLVIHFQTIDRWTTHCSLCHCKYDRTSSSLCTRVLASIDK